MACEQLAWNWHKYQLNNLVGDMERKVVEGREICPTTVWYSVQFPFQFYLVLVTPYYVISPFYSEITVSPYPCCHCVDHMISLHLMLVGLGHSSPRCQLFASFGRRRLIQTHLGLTGAHRGGSDMIKPKVYRQTDRICSQYLPTLCLGLIVL